MTLFVNKVRVLFKLTLILSFSRFSCLMCRTLFKQNEICCRHWPIFWMTLKLILTFSDALVFFLYKFDNKIWMNEVFEMEHYLADLNSENVQSRANRCKCFSPKPVLNRTFGRKARKKHCEQKRWKKPFRNLDLRSACKLKHWNNACPWTFSLLFCTKKIIKSKIPSDTNVNSSLMLQARIIAHSFQHKDFAAQSIQYLYIN